MLQQARRRVVVTGLGAIAPNGIGKEAFWNASIQGRSGIRPIVRFDPSKLSSRIAGEVPYFDAYCLGLTQIEATSMDRGTQFAIAASNLALEDAHLLHLLTAEERDHAGVFIGTALASVDEGEKWFTRLTDNGAHDPFPANQDDFIPTTLLMTHASASAIAAHHKLHGPCTVIATGCSAGADAIGQAYWAIEAGRADLMLTGGTDSAITHGSINAFCVIGAVSSRNDDPERASRPYDKERDGFVMAEGAGVLLLEERDHALARDAHIYAELVGFASNNSAYHMTSLAPDGRFLQSLLTLVLQESGLSPKQLDYINSHGSSTPANEVSETAAYKAVFSDYAASIPISATKSMIGHTQGAASAIEAIITTLVIENQIIPPTINQEEPDPRCDLDYVPNVARQAKVNVALSHSSGFGGVNSALVFAHPDWRDEKPENVFI